MGRQPAITTRRSVELPREVFDKITGPNQKLRARMCEYTGRTDYSFDVVPIEYTLFNKNTPKGTRDEYHMSAKDRSWGLVVHIYFTKVATSRRTGSWRKRGHHSHHRKSIRVHEFFGSRDRFEEDMMTAMMAL
jgi:hypothetical protein